MPTIPTAHPRIFWTSARKNIALTNITKFGWTPNYTDPWDCLVAWCVQGDMAAATALLTGIPNPAGDAPGLAGWISTLHDRYFQCWQPGNSGCDYYRWWDWLPVAWDALQTLPLSTWPQASRDSTRQQYTEIVQGVMGQNWGGPCQPSSNYFWGDFRNELNWALAIWWEDQPTAQAAYNFATSSRFLGTDPNYKGCGFAPVAASSNGMPSEGPGYGAYNLQYPLIPATSLRDYGVDLFAATQPWWYAAVWAFLNWCSNIPVLKKGTGKYYPQLVPYADLENNAYPNAQWTPFADFVLAMYSLFPHTLAGAAALWLYNSVIATGASPSVYWYLGVDYSIQPPAFNPNQLPLDYLDPGAFIARTRWPALGGTDVSQTVMMTETGVLGGGHAHMGAGQMQVIHKDESLARENVGYQGDTADWFTSAQPGLNLTGQLVAGGTLAVGGNYFWRVAAHGIAPESGNPPTGFSSPEYLSLTPTSALRSASMTWRPAVGATGYRVFRGNDTTKEYVAVADVGPSTFAFTDTGSSIANQFAGGPLDAHCSVNHDPVLWGEPGIWPAGQANGDWGTGSRVRLQSHPQFAFEVLDLSPSYLGDSYSNPYSPTHVRDRIFLRSVGSGDDVAIVEIDRCTANGAAERYRVFRGPNQPTIKGNTILAPGINREQKIWLLLPMSPTFQVFDEGALTGNKDGPNYNWTVWAKDPAAASTSYFIVVRHFRNTAGADITVNLSDGGAAWNLTVGNNQLVIPKGSGSASGGSVNGVALIDHIQAFTVNADGSGYAWGS